MNYLKIQQDLLKAADARDGWKHKHFNVPYFVTDDRVWVCPNGMFAIGIPKNQFYLDIEKVWGSQTPWNGQTLFDDARNARPAEDTSEIRIDGKIKKHRFVVSDEDVFVNHDFLKYFDESPVFEGIGPKAPIFVYEFDKLVGVILPIA